MKPTVLLMGLLMAAGCSQEPARDPLVDAKGPIVNPLAPGARSGAKPNGAVVGGLYTAPPGMKTGIPK